VAPVRPIETERLILRPERLEDFDVYAAMWADPVVTRYTGGVPGTREDCWTRFLRGFGMWEQMGFGFFAIEDKATGVFLGEAGFQERKRDIVPSMEGTLETGWALVPSAHGKGLATEAVRAVLGWADAAHPGRRFTALIDAANNGSMRVAEKSGFRWFADTTYHGMAAVLYER
jgi:RimJ/RimL family protein N-acetyltransferase